LWEIDLKKEKETETENPISYIHRMEFGEKKYINLMGNILASQNP